MSGFGFLLLLVGTGLIIWGGAELARQTGAGLPPNPFALIVLLIFAIFRTKSGFVGLCCVFIGLFIATSGAAITNQPWMNKQDVIQIEVIGSPSLGQLKEGSEGTTRDVIINVKVINADSKSHDLCIEASILANLPDSIMNETNVSNPIEWWGINWDTVVNDCQFHIEANTISTVSIGIGGGSGGHWAFSPSPLSINSISDLKIVQICAQIRSVDGKNTVPIEWRKYTTPESCDGN